MPRLLRPLAQKKVNKYRYIKPIIFCLGAILLGIILVAFFLQSSLFSITNIDCKTQYSSCTEEEVNQFQPFLNQNLFFISEDKIKDSVGQNISSRNITIHKIFPNTLGIFIEKRKPLVAIIPENLEKGYFLADWEGYIIEFAEQSMLPKISVSSGEGIIVGQKLDDKLSSAVKIMHLSYKSQQISSGKVSEGSLIANLEDNTEVVFSLERDPKVIVGALQLIRARSRIDGKLPKRIDLRYINPVLRY